MTPPAPARIVAARVLERVARDAAFADLALDAELTRRPLGARDIGLATEIVYGTLRWQRYLDWILQPHAKRPLASLDIRPLVLLRLTAYQVVFLERVPAFAAVNDAVSLARRPDKPGVERFVNAVLRAFARRGEREREPKPPADRIEALATRWSHPTWLAARWIARWGEDEAVALMRAMNERPPLTVRANTLRTTREALADRLRSDERVDVAPTTYAPDGLRVDGGGAPAAWPAFQQGLLAVQDESSILVAHLLAPRPGDTIGDTCAAPGTKTTHMAQLMDNRGRIVAFDPQPGRLARVADACTRLGVTIVETADGTAEALAPRFPSACDGVLVDAPCSNLGVLRRNPEVKWRRGAADVTANGERQRAILAAAASMVTPGGRLVYATCSLEPEENDAVAAWLVETHGDFAIDPPTDFPIAPDDAGFVRCLPHRHGTDGFTAVRFRRAAHR